MVIIITNLGKFGCLLSAKNPERVIMGVTFWTLPTKITLLQKVIALPQQIFNSIPACYVHDCHLLYRSIEPFNFLSMVVVEY